MKLQEIDGKLSELEVSKVFYPKLLEQLHDEVTQLDSDLADTETQIIQLKKDIDLKELELRTTKEKLANSQQRLLTVQSNKEYDAVQHEILSSEESIAQLEEDTIRMMEDLEIMQKLGEELAAKLEIARPGNEKQIEEIEQKYATIEEKAAEIRRKYEELATKVDRRNLSAYKRIREGTQGHAVVKVISRACGGCFQALPPKQIQEIRRMTVISFCEACGRILVWDDDVSP